MSPKPADPNEGLSADASLAVEHTPEREAEQLAHFGGERDPIDDFDATGLDDGSDPNYVAPEKDDAEDDDEDKDADDKDDSDAPDDTAASDDDTGDTDDEGADAENADAEDADDADADDDSEDEDAADQKPAQKGIPKHRFDEVNERRKAAEQELAAIKAQSKAGEEAAEDQFDFDAAEKEYIEFTLDGDTDGALDKRKEIRAAEHAAWAAETKQETKSEISQEEAEQELNQMAGEAQTMFDEFNPDHEKYDQVMVDKVMVFYKGYATSGTAESPADAFVMALADAAEIYGLDPAGEEPEEKTPEEKTPTGKQKTGGKKKEEARKRAHQPVATTGAAADDAGVAAPSIEDMTDEEIDALPAKALARLRGDFV